MILQLLALLAKLAAGPFAVEIYDLIAMAEKVLSIVAADEAVVAAGGTATQAVQVIPIAGMNIEFGVYAKKAA